MELASATRTAKTASSQRLNVVENWRTEEPHGANLESLDRRGYSRLSCDQKSPFVRIFCSCGDSKRWRVKTSTRREPNPGENAESMGFWSHRRLWFWLDSAKVRLLCQDPGASSSEDR